MGVHQRSQKGQSFQLAYKSFAALALIIAACSSKTSVPPALQQALSKPDAPALNVTSLGIQLTQQGDNDSPSVSADGKMVVYSSRKRPGHPQSQIYIYDLETLKERRVTYQDGDCRDPIILKDLKHLVYASTTDELKESPLLLRPKDASSVYPFTDLYQSDFSGSDIDRLTQNAGFDGLPVQRIDRPQSITFSRAHDGKLAAYQLNLESKQSVLVLAKKDISIESLQVSPDKKQWAWIERTSDGKSQVFTGPYSLAASKHVPVELPAGEYKDVQWISPQKILMTAKTIKKYFQFYTYDFEKKCLQSLFDSNTDLSSPRLIAEKQSLIFASSQSGSSQIYYKTLPPPTEPCLALNSDQKPN